MFDRVGKVASMADVNFMKDIDMEEEAEENVSTPSRKRKRGSPCPSSSNPALKHRVPKRCAEKCSEVPEKDSFDGSEFTNSLYYWMHLPFQEPVTVAKQLVEKNGERKIPLTALQKTVGELFGKPKPTIEDEDLDFLDNDEEVSEEKFYVMFGTSMDLEDELVVRNRANEMNMNNLFTQCKSLYLVLVGREGVLGIAKMNSVVKERVSDSLFYCDVVWQTKQRLSLTDVDESLSSELRTEHELDASLGRKLLSLSSPPPESQGSRESGHHSQYHRDRYQNKQYHQHHHQHQHGNQGHHNQDPTQRQPFMRYNNPEQRADNQYRDNQYRDRRGSNNRMGGRGNQSGARYDRPRTDAGGYDAGNRHNNYGGYRDQRDNNYGNNNQMERGRPRDFRGGNARDERRMY